MQRPDYKNVFAISQSAIKAFINKPIQKFKKIYIDKEDEEEDSDSFSFGSLVDTLAFQPELMDDRFYIPDSEVTVPGEKVKVIVDKLYKEAKEIVENREKLNAQGNLPEPLHVSSLTDLYEWGDLIYKIAKETKYGGTTWSRNRILDNVYSDAYAYFGMLGTARGRNVITGFDNADAIECVDALKACKNTVGYFVQQPDETLLFQQEIFVEYSKNGLIVPLKGAIDIIRMNHTARWVQVPDLKTTYNSEGFLKIARTYGYVTQASFYDFIVREWLKTYEDGKYKDYEVLPPINIVIDRAYKIPYIYEYDWQDIEIARYGSDSNNVKGWMAILDEIMWHIESGVWDRPKELFETGSIKLKIYNK